MPYADNDGIKIYYEVEGVGPPLVLQHGFGAYLEAWYDVGYVAALKDDYQLIMIDARGHGKSDKPHDRESYHLTLRVGDVIAVLDDMKINKAHYCGYSMGGYIGWGIAMYNSTRFRSIIVGGGGAFEETRDESVDGPLPMQKFVRQDLDTICTATVAMFGDYWQPKWMLHYRENDYKALDVAASRSEGVTVEMMSSMKIPCMIFTGEKDDGFLRAQKKSTIIPNVVFVPLPGLNHIGAFCRADLVAPHIKKFLEQVEQTNIQ